MSQQRTFVTNATVSGGLLAKGVTPIKEVKGGDYWHPYRDDWPRRIVAVRNVRGGRRITDYLVTARTYRYGRDVPTAVVIGGDDHSPRPASHSPTTPHSTVHCKEHTMTTTPPVRDHNLRVIESRADLRFLADDLGVRPDWHEPDEREVNATIIGDHLDNAMGATVEVTMGEYNVLLTKGGHPVAVVNLATLLAMGAGTHKG